MLLLPRRRQVHFAFGRVPAVLQEFAPLGPEVLFPPAPPAGKEERKVQDGEEG
jgi:hypothetical protein